MVPADLHYLALPVDVGVLGVFRHVLAAWASDVGMLAEGVQELTVATYEAMSNVVAHAYRGTPGVFDLHATYLTELRQVTVIVIDYGRWRPALVDDRALRPGGRGLHLIRACADDTVVAAGVDGSSVRMNWNI